MGAAAAVLRNDHWEAIAGGSWSMFTLLDAASVEAAALRHGCSPVIVESYSSPLVLKQKYTHLFYNAISASP